MWAENETVGDCGVEERCGSIVSLCVAVVGVGVDWYSRSVEKV